MKKKRVERKGRSLKRWSGNKMMKEDENHDKNDNEEEEKETRSRKK
jgi:hypothetical protein